MRKLAVRKLFDFLGIASSFLFLVEFSRAERGLYVWFLRIASFSISRQVFFWH